MKFLRILLLHLLSALLVSENQALGKYYNSNLRASSVEQSSEKIDARVANLAKPGAVAQGVKNTVPRTKDALGHIFRDAPGHINPTTVAAQSRYIRLFENVANNTKNFNPNVLTNYQRAAGGFQGFSQTFRNGQQIWVQTFNGKIINAGVNIIPK